MSIYSGFSSRQQQTTYNNLVVKVMTLMQRYIAHLIEQTPSIAQSEQHLTFAHRLSRTMHRLRAMEEHKYLQPKFGVNLKEFYERICPESANEAIDVAELMSRIQSPMERLTPIRKLLPSMDIIKEETKKVTFDPSVYKRRVSTVVDVRERMNKVTPTSHRDNLKPFLPKSHHLKAYQDTRQRGSKVESSYIPPSRNKTLIY